jgi:hypothetical protein
VLFDIGLIPSAVLLAGLAAVIYAPSIRQAAGHLLPLVFALSYLCGGIIAMNSGAPSALWSSLLIAGVLVPALVWFSYFRRSRGAWAFLVAFCGVFFVLEFFGAMKLHNETQISRGVFLIGPALKVVAMVALIELRGQYAEPAGSAAVTA